MGEVVEEYGAQLYQFCRMLPAVAEPAPEDNGRPELLGAAPARID